jgi:hypothetical protein
MRHKKKPNPLTVAERDNNSNKLDKVALAKEVVDNVGSFRGASKTLKYHLYRMFGFNTAAAADLAGITLRTGYDLNQRLANDERQYKKLAHIVSGFPDKYRELCKLRLMGISNIEDKALGLYAEDPKLAIERPALLKHMKQAAGIVLEEPQTQVVPNINIGQLQAIILQSLESKKKEEDE